MKQVAWLSLTLLTILLGGSPVGAQTTFIVGSAGEPVQLDPAVVGDGFSASVTGQIYEGLVKFKAPTTEVIPSLAEKWQVSPDGTVWTFTLRPGVQFHDGTPCDAAAVVWNVDRWRLTQHPQHANQLQAGRAFNYYRSQFGGFDEQSLITKVEAVNTRTVRVTLKTPQAPFLANLAIPFFALASPTAVEKFGIDFGKHPVGTGPFRFVDWRPGQEVILEANPAYWDQDYRAKLQRVVIRTIKDNAQRLAALKAGEIHTAGGLNPDDLRVARADPTLQVQLFPANNTGFLAFNFKVKEFQDKRVRQAIAHAINKRAIVDAFYGGAGLVATQFQPPVLWGYNKELKDYDYDPQRAKDLLTQAGFGQGLKTITWDDGKQEPLAFWYLPVSRPYFPNPKDIAEAIAADLGRAGITVQLQTTDWAVYLDKTNHGQLPLFMGGWIGDNGDPDNFLCFFYCQPSAPNGGYVNPQLIDLLREAQRVPDQDKRAALYRQAEQILHDEAARIFIANYQPTAVFQKRVQGILLNPVGPTVFNTLFFQE